jgi:hypothetical protein
MAPWLRVFEMLRVFMDELCEEIDAWGAIGAIVI